MLKLKKIKTKKTISAQPAKAVRIVPAAMGIAGRVMKSMSNEQMTSPLEDYLKAILVLSIRNETVGVEDIASFLDVTRPSVHRAVQVLKEADYLDSEAYGEIKLTPAGESHAATLLRRHKMIKRFLEQTLSVPERLAEEDACRMAHMLNRETVDALYKYLERCEARKE